MPSEKTETPINNPSHVTDVTLEKEHKWGKWAFKNDKEDERICYLCGSIENQPHQFKKSETSYEEKGNRGHIVNEKYKCTICNKAQYTENFMEAHQLSKWENIGGYTRARHCYVCGYTETRTDYNPGDNQGGNSGNNPWEDLNRHLWRGWVFKNEEEDERTCIHCGKKETQRHIFKEVGIEYEAGQDGTHIVSRSYVCITCNIAKYTTSATEEHLYGEGTEKIVANNDGTHNIETEYSCSICKYTNKDTNQEECKYGEWKVIEDNVEARYCEVCQYEETRSIEHEHDWSDWSFKDDENDERTCSICGEAETQPHNYKKSETVKSNHNGTHTIEATYACATCGNTYADNQKKSCEYGAWQYISSSTEVRYCKVCGYKQTYTHQTQHYHSWGEWVVKNDKEEERTCRTCGKKETRSHTHQYSSDIKDATSNNDGTHTMKVEYMCVGCKYNYVDTVQEACKFGEWTFNAGDGTMVRSCSVCGYQENSSHQHDKAPDDLVYQCKAPNEDDTHLLEASYTCQSCGENITVSKSEACDFGETTIERSNANDKHLVVKVCKVCNWRHEEYEDCVPTGEMKCMKVYDQIYNYYDCVSCGDWCTRSYHTEHFFGPWESRGPDSGHIRYCLCVEARETGEHDYVYDKENNPTVQTCSVCGQTKEVPVVDHNHGLGTYDDMGTWEMMLSPAYAEITNKSPVPNPNPSPDSYCFRFEFMCKTCGVPYYIHRSHKFENGVCTLGHCNHIAQGS